MAASRNAVAAAGSLAAGYTAETGVPGLRDVPHSTINGVITFSFNPDDAISASYKLAAKAVMAQVSTFTNLTFKEVAYGTGDDNGFNFLVEDMGPLTGGWAQLGCDYGDVAVATDYSRTDFVPGTWEFLILLHEIGHILGMPHPCDGPQPLPQNERYWDATVMGYGGTFTPTTYMPYDIAELQYQFGVNHSYRSGNDVYNLFSGGPTLSRTLWDGGGIDTLSAASFAGNAVLDLREGFGYDSRDAAGTGTYKPMALASGANIENATGGNGNDLITGNQLNNTLIGGAGNDTLTGGDGNDRFEGGAGADNLNGGASTTGDIASYASASAGLTLNLIDASLSTGDAKGDIYTAIERFELTNFNDSFSGSNFADRVSGGVGVDTLVGQGGDDKLYGDLDADQLFGGVGSDLLFGGAGNDTLTGGSGNDTLTGGSGNDTISGGENDDIILGNQGNDSINAGLGADRIIGGTGADVIDFAESTQFQDIATYNSFTESGWTVSTWDIIQNFSKSAGTTADRIDLSAIDANPSSAGNDAFVWRGTGAFQNTGGEVRIDTTTDDVMIYINADTDSFAEMVIRVVDMVTLDASDFIL